MIPELYFSLSNFRQLLKQMKAEVFYVIQFNVNLMSCAAHRDQYTSGLLPLSKLPNKLKFEPLWTIT